MPKNQLLVVKGQPITLTKIGENDFISLSDLAKEFGGNDQIKNWIRTRRTVEFLGAWEALHNPGFNMVEFHHVKNDSGSDKFIMSPTQWVERTGAVGIVAKSGRYGGGTFAHTDIAFEFCSWLSPEFKLYLITEFQRLKAQEQSAGNLEWNVRRVLTKVNYRIHTDAIKEHIIPVTRMKEGLVYASEADVLNLALFHCTAKDWREANPQLVLQGRNIRDYATLNELNVLNNLESVNSQLIKDGHPQPDRLRYLANMAADQLEALRKIDFMGALEKTSQPGAPKPPLPAAPAVPKKLTVPKGKGKGKPGAAKKG